MEFWALALIIFLIVTMLLCHCNSKDPHTNREQQPNSVSKPTQTVIYTLAPLPNNYNNNPLYCPPPAATNIANGTIYTNTMGIQLQVAPPVVVDMSPDTLLPVYTPHPSVQEIQFSSHPRPTFVTTTAEDPEPVEPMTRT
ncbi:hypothetical protein BG015_010373 [Linnemannia schmuckeri]|uniref:Uncharacterized protein n=1 Tax=Linnemannia schmuckeri TaxID=64567 RepID=A0A9P5RXL8_9FUNG|nr:hypothetical protein BG015_010373 [Linnemannia schmuckeri]